MALAELVEGALKIRIFGPNEICTTEPNVSHNVYMYRNSVIHTVKHGEAGDSAGWHEILFLMRKQLIWMNWTSRVWRRNRKAAINLGDRIRLRVETELLQHARSAPASPSLLREVGSRISGASAATSASASPGGVSTPVTPSSTTNSAAPARDATKAAPDDIASISVRRQFVGARLWRTQPARWRNEPTRDSPRPSLLTDDDSGGAVWGSAATRSAVVLGGASVSTV